MAVSDCGFKRDEHWFRYRAVGILVKEGKILLQRRSHDDFLTLPGGGVEMGETSVSAVEREFLEETGLQTAAERLAVVCENFFKGKDGRIEGLLCHTVEFYYTLRLLDDGNSRSVSDNGEELVWVPLEDLSSLILKPSFLNAHLEEILREGRTFHFLEEDDRTFQMAVKSIN